MPANTLLDTITLRVKGVPVSLRTYFDYLKRPNFREPPEGINLPENMSPIHAALWKIYHATINRELTLRGCPAGADPQTITRLENAIPDMERALAERLGEVINAPPAPIGQPNTKKVIIFRQALRQGGTIVSTCAPCPILPENTSMETLLALQTRLSDAFPDFDSDISFFVGNVGDRCLYIYDLTYTFVPRIPL